ncbi:diaminopimelate epimerase [Desulfoplanes formicivorans]|uniref:Diaminopimelate epimerase n=1 Tax=Desulfoplanes formicivorans TaxID=1592317 RepID=A0A194AJ21_9BACT|nr:diaminopimelate epimerase [Desulfoplanes formicivorans]GAU09328.1 diaminopimelate epimerase [Desulfoplanes formicivorans]
MRTSPEKAIAFYKMQGSGNDFILVDNRYLGLPTEVMPHWAKALCARAFGIGADGLIFIDKAPSGEQVDYRWHFYNADGSRAEMCGNGSRCVARLAFELGIAGPNQVFMTDAGPIQAHIIEQTGHIKVQLTRPQDLKLNISLAMDTGEAMQVHFVNTGVPHTVVLTDHVKAINVLDLGNTIRFHDHFAPNGTNVNFVQIEDLDHILLRTYERGVENETYACGTGACAAVYVAHALRKCSEHVSVTTSGGEKLVVHLENDDIFLQGDAVIVYTGSMNPETFGLTVG